MALPDSLEARCRRSIADALSHSELHDQHAALCDAYKRGDPISREALFITLALDFLAHRMIAKHTAKAK
jgi:hypothetical protein